MIYCCQDKAYAEMRIIINKHSVFLTFFMPQGKEEQKMTIQEAVLMIQTMERARQGRLRAKFMRDIRQQEERERLAQQRGGRIDEQLK